MDWIFLAAHRCKINKYINKGLDTCMHNDNGPQSTHMTNSPLIHQHHNHLQMNTLTKNTSELKTTHIKTLVLFLCLPKRCSVSAPQEVCVKLTAQDPCFKKPPETCQLDCSFQCVCLWAGRRLGWPLYTAHTVTHYSPTPAQLLALRPSHRLNQTFYACVAFLPRCFGLF